MTSELAHLLWNSEALRLTEQQNNTLKVLQKILSEMTSPVAIELRLCKRVSWTQADMRALEANLLKRIRRPDMLNVFRVLSKLIARYQALTGIECAYPRALHRVVLENNPFHVNLPAAENLIHKLSSILIQEAKRLPAYQRTLPEDDTAKRVIVLGVLSSVLHFHLLHRSMIISLIESMADRVGPTLFSGKYCYMWGLSLSWQGEADAEYRLFVPDQLTGALLARVPEATIRRIFAAGFDGNRPLYVRHKIIYSTLERAFSSLLRDANLGHAVTLASTLSAAGTVAYLRMPAVIVAARSRKIVTHAPRKNVMFRILNGIAVDDVPTRRPETALSKLDLAMVEQEIEDNTWVEPSWLDQMRSAFKQQHKDLIKKSLLKMIKGSEQPGPRLASFALSLLSDRKLAITTAKRYSLLIAKRCGCRLDLSDPGTFTINELEDLYRDALDDDYDQDETGASLQTVQRNKRITCNALIAFHRYLEKYAKRPPLQELAGRLKSRGLMAVDANFITVDEYFRVLEYISGIQGPSDPHLRSVLRLILILGFRCGLRRFEVLYLLADDIDSADHLHIRNNSFRDVKTTNSTRSLPVGLLLSSAEMFELRTFIEGRRNVARGQCTLLFSTQLNSSIPLNADALVATFHDIMRNSLQDPSLKMHHLRHSFGTLMTAKLLPNTIPFVRRFLRKHPKTLDWLEQREVFRSQLFGTSKLRGLDIQAVAHLLGHGSPSTSVEHYIHSLDFFEQETGSK